MPFDSVIAPEKPQKHEAQKQVVKISYYKSKKPLRRKVYFGGFSLLASLICAVMIINPSAFVSASGEKRAEYSEPEVTEEKYVGWNSVNRIDGASPFLNLQTITAKRGFVPRIVKRKGYDSIYAQAEKKYGVSRHLIAAVHFAETGQSGDTEASSYAGAQGPMQFMPSTFQAYAQDGDGDGVRSIYDVHDAIFTAANYLAANGANRGNVRGALYRYNHSYVYVESVLSYAQSLGYTP